MSRRNSGTSPPPSSSPPPPPSVTSDWSTSVGLRPYSMGPSGRPSVVRPTSVDYRRPHNPRRMVSPDPVTRVLRGPTSPEPIQRPVLHRACSSLPAVSGESNGKPAPQLLSVLNSFPALMVEKLVPRSLQSDVIVTAFYNIAPGIKFDCYHTIIPWVRSASPEAATTLSLLLPPSGAIVARDFGLLLAYIVFVYDVKRMMLPRLTESVIAGYNFLHFDTSRTVPVMSAIAKLFTYNGFVGGTGGVDAVEMINVAASVNATTIAANEASTAFRGNLQCLTTVTTVLSAEDAAMMKRERRDLWFTGTQTNTGDHPYMASCREVIRADYNKAAKTATTNKRTLVLGASAREYRMYHANPLIHFQFSNQEGKDTDRLIGECLSQLRSSKASKLGGKLKDVRSIERVRNEVHSVENMMIEWKESRRLPVRMMLWDESQLLLHHGLLRQDDIGMFLAHSEVPWMLDWFKESVTDVAVQSPGNNAYYDQLIFEDVGYNFTSYEWYLLFKNTGAYIAHGYLCLPWQLLFPDMMATTGYLYKTEGENSLLTYPGYSNGYCHPTKAWRTILDGPVMEFPDMYIGVEVISRCGPMANVKLFRTHKPEIFTRTVGLPNYLRTVRLLHIKKCMNPDGSLKIQNLEYFAVKEDEFHESLNYALDVAEEALKFRAVMIYIRRRHSGMSLTNKDLSNVWTCPKALIPEFALVVYLYALGYRDKMKLVEKDFTFKYYWRLGNFVGYYLSFALLPLYPIFKFFETKKYADILVKDLKNEFWQTREARGPRIIRPMHVFTGPNPEDCLDKSIKVEEIDEEDKSDCCFCEELTEAVQTQIFTCARNLPETHYHKFSLSGPELTTLKGKLSDITNDPVGLKEVKEGALRKLPVAPFSIDVRVNYICGPPGTGKSHAIRGLASTADVVVAPFSRLREDYVDFVHPVHGVKRSLKFYTQHTGFAAANHTRVFVDEYTAMPYECLAIILFNCSATEVIFVGDHRQTALINEVEGIAISSKINFEEVRTHELVKNYRNPADAVIVLNTLYGYDMRATNNRRGYSFGVHEEFEKYSRTHTPLFFRHASAERFGMHSNTMDKVTVRANQGRTFEDVVLVVTNDDQNLFEMPSMAIVALSRHRNTCVILYEDGPAAAFVGNVMSAIPPEDPDNIPPSGDSGHYDVGESSHSKPKNNDPPKGGADATKGGADATRKRDNNMPPAPSSEGILGSGAALLTSAFKSGYEYFQTYGRFPTVNQTDASIKQGILNYLDRSRGTKGVVINDKKSKEPKEVSFDPKAKLKGVATGKLPPLLKPAPRQYGFSKPGPIGPEEKKESFEEQGAVEGSGGGSGVRTPEQQPVPEVVVTEIPSGQQLEGGILGPAPSGIAAIPQDDSCLISSLSEATGIDATLIWGQFLDVLGPDIRDIMKEQGGLSTKDLDKVCVKYHYRVMVFVENGSAFMCGSSGNVVATLHFGGPAHKGHYTNYPNAPPVSMGPYSIPRRQVVSSSGVVTNIPGSEYDQWSMSDTAKPMPTTIHTDYPEYVVKEPTESGTNVSDPLGFKEFDMFGEDIKAENVAPNDARTVSSIQSGGEEKLLKNYNSPSNRWDDLGELEETEINTYSRGFLDSIREQLTPEDMVFSSPQIEELKAEGLQVEQQIPKPNQSESSLVSLESDFLEDDMVNRTNTYAGVRIAENPLFMFPELVPTGSLSLYPTSDTSNQLLVCSTSDQIPSVENEPEIEEIVTEVGVASEPQDRVFVKMNYGDFGKMPTFKPPHQNLSATWSQLGTMYDSEDVDFGDTEIVVRGLYESLGTETTFNRCLNTMTKIYWLKYFRKQLDMAYQDAYVGRWPQISDDPSVRPQWGTRPGRIPHTNRAVDRNLLHYHGGPFPVTVLTPIRDLLTKKKKKSSRIAQYMKGLKAKATSKSRLDKSASTSSAATPSQSSRLSSSSNTGATLTARQSTSSVSKRFRRFVPNFIGGAETNVTPITKIAVADIKQCQMQPLINTDPGFVEMARLFTNPVMVDEYLVEHHICESEEYFPLEQTPYDCFKALIEDFQTSDEFDMTLTNQETLNYLEEHFGGGVYDTTRDDQVNQRGHLKKNEEWAWSLLALAPGVTYFKNNDMQALHCLQSRYLTKKMSALFNHESVKKAYDIADLFVFEHMDINYDIFNEQDMCTTTLESEHAMKIKNYEGQCHYDLEGDIDVRFTMKDIFKPFKTKIDIFKSGQGISAWSKDTQTIFQTAFRVLNKHFINCLKPHVVYDNGVDEITLMNRVNALMSLLPSVCVNGVIDATACDSGQNRFTQRIERRIMERMGVSEDFLEWYYQFRESYTMRGYGVVANIKDIKTSGEPATLLNNTMLMAALMNYLVRGEGPCVLVIKGDDGLKRQANLKYDTRLKLSMDKYLKMEFKVDIDVPITFCGYYLCGSVLVPDLIRKVFKILGHRFKNYEHFKEYQQSLRDWILNVNRLGLNDVCGVAAFSYTMQPDYCFSLFQAIVSLSHIDQQQFEDNFTYRRFTWVDIEAAKEKWVQKTRWYKGPN